MIHPFIKQLGLITFAVPMGFGVISVSLGNDSLGEIVGPLVRNYQITSAGFWIRVLGDGVSKGPREHLFLTFSALVFLPSLFYVLYCLVRHWGKPIPTALAQTHGALWLLVNILAIFGLVWALVPKFHHAFSLLSIGMMLTFVLRYALDPDGDDKLVKLLTPPSYRGKEDVINRCLPYAFYLTILWQALTDISTFPPVEQGRWIYVIVLTTEIAVISLSAILGNRLPAYVYLVALGVLTIAWTDSTMVEPVRQFSKDYEISLTSNHPTTITFCKMLAIDSCLAAVGWTSSDIQPSA